MTDFYLLKWNILKLENVSLYELLAFEKSKEVPQSGKRYSNNDQSKLVKQGGEIR